MRGPAAPADESVGDGETLGYRETLGWSGVPSPDGAGGRQHLPIIHRGLQILGEARLNELSNRVERMSRGAAVLNAQRDMLSGRLKATVVDFAATMARRASRCDIDSSERAHVLATDQIVHADEKICAAKTADRNGAIEVMDDLRRDLSAARSSDETAELVQKVRIADAAEAYRDVITAGLTDFFALKANPFDPGWLRISSSDRPRSTANVDGTLDLVRPDRQELLHELGHLMEFADPQLYAAARDWRRARGERSFGKETVEKLSILEPKVGYLPDEAAVRDEFHTLYVGAVYEPLCTTEVVSTGFEWFSSPSHMLELYRHDPEHFFFVVGVLAR